MSGDAINCHWRHGCLQAFTPAAFPPTTLIRLYELLKNNSLFRSRPQDWMNQRSGLRRSNVRIEDNTTCTMRACWWRMTGSNRRPPACKAGALPAELIPQCPLTVSVHWNLVGLVGLEPTTPALSRRCSNQLSYRPIPHPCE